ncbi:MAG: bifunctional precorrin-2 dehydrogenase/sirohydrochlorin ferrochelatase [Acidobacteria bacterium]|nr:bifunctional precorrin-2 dehydrogenase/sirohydrochlorin ferrochelatase [Acidobacteriota bacterium]
MRGDDDGRELLPLFLKLAGRSVLVVGGGVVATSKIAALAATGARITVVAPEIAQPIRQSGAALRERPFEERDLDGQWLVISAAPPDVNRVVADAAARRQIFINAVDDPANATAYFGGVVRRAGVTVAISTDGRAPAIAGLLREGLEALLPDDLDRWLERADVLKHEWRSTGVPMARRRPQLLEALNRLYEARRDAADQGAS